MVFLLADDMGWGDLNSYGNSFVRTPNLDNLAHRGTRYTQFYVASPVCSPTRVSFMTGHFPARHGFHYVCAHATASNKKHGVPNWLPPFVPTITSILKNAGYATGHFGKWHLGSKKFPSPGAYGIDDHRILGGPGPRPGLVGSAGVRWLTPAPGERNWDANRVEYIADEAIRFIEANKNSPFYLNVWTILPHAVLLPTDEQLAQYRNMRRPDIPHMSPREVYHASLTALDTAMGRIIDKIDSSGLSDKTLILFSSDNGPERRSLSVTAHSAAASTGPFRGQKSSLYEGGVRMPLIVTWPGRLPANRVDDSSVVSSVDYLPTILKLAGVPMPDDVQPDGEDVSDVFEGNPRERTRLLYWENRFNYRADHPIHVSPGRAVREGKWKFHMTRDGTRRELYDIPNDPTELTNLVNEHPGVAESLAQKLEAWANSLPEGPYDEDAGKREWKWPEPLPE
ncbi:MAG: sulfatase-like hydrolase/transferase [Acidobacteriota bacterium]|nr:sulfatase-like hydrolase/transferase [Acidobacteriota bacterium]